MRPIWQFWSTAETLRDRADFWSDVVMRGVIDAEMRTQDARRFDGRLASRTIGDTRLVNFRTAAHRVNRTVRQARRGHAHLMISLQINGVSHILQDGREAALGPFGIAIIDSARPFSIEFPQTVERRLVLLPRHMMAPWLRADRGPILLPIHNLCAQIARQAIVQITDNSLNWADDDCWRALVALPELLRGAFDDSPCAKLHKCLPSRLDQLKQFVRRTAHQSHMTPSKAARAMNVSVRTLHRLFATDGQSFARFVLAERLSRARAMIETHPDTTLTKVALSSGFDDASHFSRSYRVRFGESPRQTRDRARQARTDDAVTSE